MTKVYLIVLCGGADRPVAALAGRTPLDAAKTPTLDRLAEKSDLGLITVIDHGICPESDSGIMALLGYDPHRYYTGRGALEALGMGYVRRGENAVGFRINFASYDAARDWLDRRTSRDLDDAELAQLVAAIKDADPLAGLDVEFDIVGFGRHRGIVCLRSGRPLGANVSNTDPGFRREGPFGIPNDVYEPRPLPCRPLDDSPGAAWTAELVNHLDARIAEVLADHPVNAARSDDGRCPANRVLFRDAGQATPDLEPFAKRYARSLAMYGQVPAERGLCALLGGTWHEAGQGEGIADRDYYLPLVEAIVADPADVVVVHLKAPDEPGHDNRPQAKVEAFETVDDLFVSPLVAAIDATATLIVTCDHATPCELGIHSSDPVPVLVYPGTAPVPNHRFRELDARAGTLPVRRALNLLDVVFTRRASLVAPRWR